MFQNSNTKSGRYVRYIEQPHQSFINRTVDFHQDEVLFRIFANPFEALYEDVEPTLQLELISLPSSDKLRTSVKIQRKWFA
jgi:hypothetical protein